MKNAFSCLLVIICLSFLCFCQPACARPLTLGDAVPDYTIHNIVNAPVSMARLSDYKNDLLILDFMATSCGSCMKNLFRTDSLEALFSGRLHILPVSYESKSKLLTALQRRYAGRKISSPFVAEDSVLTSWFPHQLVSHMVWIYKGTVRAITVSEYVNAGNIEAMLRGADIRLPLKKDVGNYNPAYPVLAPNAEAVIPTNYPALKYYSVVPGYLDGFAWSAGIYTDTASDIRRCFAINETILELYLQACNKPYLFPATSIVLEVADTGRFRFPGKGYQSAWREKNCYSYEATYPAHTDSATIRSKMLTDLDTYLGLHGHLEKRKFHCKVFRPIAGDSLRSSPPSNTIIRVQDLALDLNKLYTGLPFFNEVPEDLNLYVEEPAPLTDLSGMEKILAAHGVYMADEVRELEVLVISDRPR